MKRIIILFLVSSSVIFTQDFHNSHFFFHPIVDAGSSNNYASANAAGDFYDHHNQTYFRFNGNYNYNKFSFGLEAKMSNELTFNLEESRITIGGRYNFNVKQFQVSVGSLIDLDRPFYSRMEAAYSLFSAVRYNVNERIQIAGSARFQSNSSINDFEEILGFGGMIFLLPRLNLITEMNYSLEENEFYFGGGFEYNFIESLNLKGGLFSNREKAEYSYLIGLSYNWI